MTVTKVVGPTRTTGSTSLNLVNISTPRVVVLGNGTVTVQTPWTIWAPLGLIVVWSKLWDAVVEFRFQSLNGVTLPMQEIFPHDYSQRACLSY